MELSDEKVLETLLRSWEQEAANKHMGSAQTGRAQPCMIYQGSVKKAMLRRCKCGHCKTCQENARWEQIFQAKFEDPDYYRRLSVSHTSPLTAL